MPRFTHLDAADKAGFARDGYLIKRGLFSADEVALCNRVIATDPAIQGSRLKLADAAGGSRAGPSGCSAGRSTTTTAS